MSVSYHQLMHCHQFTLTHHPSYTQELSLVLQEISRLVQSQDPQNCQCRLFLTHSTPCYISLGFPSDTSEDAPK